MIAFFLSSSGLSGGRRVLLEHARRLPARGLETTVVAGAIPAGTRLLVATRYRDVATCVALSGGAFPVAHLIQGDDSAGPRAVLAEKRGWLEVLERRRARRKLARVERVLALPTRKIAVARHLVARHPGALLAPNGVDLAVFRPGPPEERSRAILIAGPRSVPTKRIEVALAAARATGARVVHLAPTHDETHPDADERVSALDEAGVARLLARVRVYVSAVSRDEGFDLVALEAMACGVSCVLSGGGAHEELAPSLVAGESRDALAAAARSALDDRADRERRAEVGLAVARSRSWDEVLPTIEEAYRRALAGVQ